MMEQPNKDEMAREEEKAHRIAALISGYIHHALTVDEHDELDTWVGESDENMKLFEELTDERATEEALFWLADAEGPRMLAKIKGKLTFTPPKYRLKLFRKYAVAASIVIVASAALILNFRYKARQIAKLEAEEKIAQDVAPGRDQATLTLSDGRTINLEAAKEGFLAKDGTSDISKENGQLLYKESRPEDMNAPLLNTVSTPRGGTYPLTLSDGTKIWLNAASSITFPAMFNEKERRVFITGEVYFEVAPLKTKTGKTPFIVEIKNKGITVEVLGTHFNINAYSDEATTTTTLLEGSVKVTANESVSFLKPEQEARVTNPGQINTVSDVDVKGTMAWKDGLFRFKNDNIKTIMRQVSRWYDVDVVYQGNATTTEYNCLLNRNIPVSKLLEVLTETGGVHFKIEGKKIIVSP